jgi:tetratricopeptide (TPR) repeat protein
VLSYLELAGGFLATLVFAIHPVNVESVAWIAQRKDLLAVFFTLLSFYWYLKAEDGRMAPRTSTADTSGGSQRRKGLEKWYWLSVAAFALAMLSKGSVATAPALLLLIIWWQRGALTKWDLLQCLPFVYAAVFLTIIHIWFQSHAVDAPIRTAGLIERSLGAGAVVWFYLSKALVPIGLAFIYPLWRISTGSFWWWIPLATAAFATAVLLLKRWQRLVRPLFVGWCFFGISLLPVIGFTDVGFMQHSLVADHYQHLALIAVAVLFAGIWAAASRNHALRSALATLVVLCLADVAFRQSQLYAGPLTLYRTAIEQNPSSRLARNNLAAALIAAGEFEESLKQAGKAIELNPRDADAVNNSAIALAKLGRINEAIERFREALRLRPNFALAHNGLGMALLEQENKTEAVEHFRRAAELKPNDADVRLDLGNALAASRRFDEAVSALEKAASLTPSSAEIELSLASALTMLGRAKDAVEHYERAIDLRPNFAQAHYGLANALKMVGRNRDAVDEFRRALFLEPTALDIHNEIGVCLLSVGDWQGAAGEFQKLLAKRPDDAEAHNNLCNALVQLGRQDAAIEQYQEALRLKPEFALASSNLGVALSKTGHLDEAIGNFQRAVNLQPDRPLHYLNLAMALHKSGREKDAVETANQGLRLARSRNEGSVAEDIANWLKDHGAAPK